MSNNARGGRLLSRAETARMWRAFDRLPLSAKAALWDGLVPYNASDVKSLVRDYGINRAIKTVITNDRLLIAQERSSPHLAARATQLRSFAHLYTREGRAA
jgi:hypothetical protein